DGMETVASWECSPNCPVKALDAQGGLRKSGNTSGSTYGGMFGTGKAATTPIREASEGYVSRYFAQFPALDDVPPFFYAGKASRRDRSEGLEDLPEGRTFDKNTSKTIIRSNPDTGEIRHFEYHPSVSKNTHPTVKNTT